MKAFDSGRSDGPAEAGPYEGAVGPGFSRAGFLGPGVSRAKVYILAAVWLLAHLPFLSPALEDIDSINFALGLHHFDPALHQPHPPGYPVYIALGRLTLGLVHVVAPTLEVSRADALA